MVTLLVVILAANDELAFPIVLDSPSILVATDELLLVTTKFVEVMVEDRDELFVDTVAANVEILPANEDDVVVKLAFVVEIDALLVLALVCIVSILVAADELNVVKVLFVVVIPAANDELLVLIVL